MLISSSLHAFTSQPELVVFYANAPSSFGGGGSESDPESQKILELGKRFVEEVLQPLRESGTKVLLMAYDSGLIKITFPKEWLAANVDNTDGKILDCYSVVDLVEQVNAQRYRKTEVIQKSSGQFHIKISVPEGASHSKALQEAQQRFAKFGEDVFDIKVTLDEGDQVISLRTLKGSTAAGFFERLSKENQKVASLVK